MASRPRNQTRPSFGRAHAGDDVEQRGLAGAVRADEPEHGAFGDREAHAGERADPAEADADVLECEHVAVAAARRPHRPSPSWTTTLRRRECRFRPPDHPYPLGTLSHAARGPVPRNAPSLFGINHFVKYLTSAIRHTRGPPTRCTAPTTCSLVVAQVSSHCHELDDGAASGAPGGCARRTPGRGGGPRRRSPPRPTRG